MWFAGLEVVDDFIGTLKPLVSMGDLGFDGNNKLLEDTLIRGLK